MNRLVFVLALLLSAFLLSTLVASCQPGSAPALTPFTATPSATVESPASTPTPTTAPTPKTKSPLPSPPLSPTPNAAEVLRKLSFDVPPIHNQMLNLTAKYPISSANATGPANVHYLYVTIGSKPWQLYWKGERFIKAVEYLGAANSLTKSGKLDTEVRPRDISQAELLQQILLVCKQAADALDGQIKQSNASQDYFYKWIKEDKLVDGHYNVPPTPEERARAITDTNKYYEHYRADLTELKDKLDSIVTANMDNTRQKAA